MKPYLYNMLKVAADFSNKLNKQAAFPTPEGLKRAIGVLLDGLKKSNPLFANTKGISNVEAQNAIDYVHVVFVLNVATKDYTADKIEERKKYLVPMLEQQLPAFFGNATIKVGYSEYPAD